MDKEKDSTRDEKGRFRKGVSGNAAGPKKGYETPTKVVKNMLFELLSGNDNEGLKQILSAQIEIASDASHAGCTKAAELILKYLAGTPRMMDLEELEAGGLRSVSVEVIHTYAAKQQDTPEFNEEYDENMIPE